MALEKKVISRMTLVSVERKREILEIFGDKETLLLRQDFIFTAVLQSVLFYMMTILILIT